jgi:DNA polymerase I-like protein with 3'-5' exonuclease and polymerase domains
LGVKGTSYEQLCGKGAHQIGFDEVDLERATHYACEDADFTLRLHHVLRPEVRALASLEYIYQLEILVSRVLFEGKVACGIEWRPAGGDYGESGGESGRDGTGSECGAAAGDFFWWV